MEINKMLKTEVSKLFDFKANASGQSFGFVMDKVQSTSNPVKDTFQRQSYTKPKQAVSSVSKAETGKVAGVGNDENTLRNYSKQTQEVKDVATDSKPTQAQAKSQNKETKSQAQGNQAAQTEAETQEQNPVVVEGLIGSISGDLAENQEELLSTLLAESIGQNGALEQSVTELDPEEDPNAQAALAQLAGLLNVPTDTLQQAMSDLNLQLSDLTEGNNLNKVLVKIYDLKNEVSLLNVPDIKEILSNAKMFIQETVIQNQGLQDPALHQMQQAQSATTLESQEAEAPRHEKEAKSLKHELVNQPLVKEQEPLTTTQITKAQSTETTQAIPVAAQAKETGAKQQGRESNLAQNNNQTQMSAYTQVVHTQEQHQERVSFAQNTVQRTVNERQVMDQIFEKVKIDVSPSASEIKVTLRPEDLGDVTLKVRTENGIITAQFVAENQRVKEIIESNFTQLKNVLQEQGLNVTQLSVSVGQENNDRMQQFLREQNNVLASRRVNAVSIAEEEAVPQEALNGQVYDNTVEYMA